ERREQGTDGAEQPGAELQVETRDIEAVVRGAYANLRFGGGIAVAEQEVQNGPGLVPLNGDEGLGAGAYGILQLGYDLNSYIGVHLLFSSTMIGGTRSDRVRDLALHTAG